MSEPIKYKDNEIIKIGGKDFKYVEYYQRLQSVDFTENNPIQIACPRCQNTQFTIGYGSYECIAYCKCGHSMVVYDG